MLKPSWEVFERLCEEHGEKPTNVFLEMNMSVANATHWKQGTSYPKIGTIVQIAKRFGKDIDYFYV